METAYETRSLDPVGRVRIKRPRRSRGSHYRRCNGTRATPNPLCKGTVEGAHGKRAPDRFSLRQKGTIGTFNERSIST